MDNGSEIRELSKNLVGRCKHCKNEESTKQSLVLPFIQFLGYDVFNPREVHPEHAADFSEKYQNRVDYALCKEETPLIGIEVKCYGFDFSRDVGQLKRYFNSVESIKVGIITDGMEYVCYSDTVSKNIMDDEPFTRFSMEDISKGKVDDATLEGIRGLRKGVFDPDHIVQKARENITQSRFEELISQWIADPSENFVRLMLKESSYPSNITSRVVDENLPIVQQAFSTVIEKRLLERVGYSERPLYRIGESQESSSSEIEKADGEAGTEERDWSIPTPTESSVFHDIKMRIAFLIKEEDIFYKIKDLDFQALKHTFQIFYKKTNRGRVLNFRETQDGALEFKFPADMHEPSTVIAKSILDVDDIIVKIFRNRAQNL